MGYKNSKYISITYEKITPDNEGEDYEEEHGWADTRGNLFPLVNVLGEEQPPLTQQEIYDYCSVLIEPDEYDIEEGITEVDLAVSFLDEEGVIEASSSSYSTGTWYIGEEQIDYHTGSHLIYHYHLNNFSKEEEREIFNKITKG